MALSQDNRRVPDKNDIIQLETKFYNGLTKTPEIIEEDSHQQRSIPEFLKKEVE